MKEYKTGKFLKVFGIIIVAMTLLLRHIMFYALKEAQFTIFEINPAIEHMQYVFEKIGYEFIFELSLVTICGIGFGFLLYGIGALIQIQSKTLTQK